jgi:hypothetical protein
MHYVVSKDYNFIEENRIKIFLFLGLLHYQQQQRQSDKKREICERKNLKSRNKKYLIYLTEKITFSHFLSSDHGVQGVTIVYIS